MYETLKVGYVITVGVIMFVFPVICNMKWWG